MKKGYAYERELLHKLWEIGFAAVRTPASGVMSYPCPDIIAGNGKTYLAIEVKMRKSLPIYIPKDKVESLRRFAEVFGAKPLIALKVKGLGWRFFTLDMLDESGSNYRIDENKFYRGLDFDELRGLKQLRLSD
ncbi:Holliday junction resolvase Hjc [Archaeoglobus sp.]